MKIWKKSILGRIASSHVMIQEQEQCAEELPKVDVAAVQSQRNRAERRLTLERQRQGLVRTWIFIFCAVEGC